MIKTHILRIVTAPAFTYTVGVVGGGLLGSGITMLVLEKKIEAKYAAIADREIAEAKELYKRRFKEGEYADLTVLGEKYADIPEAKPEVRGNDMVLEAQRIAEEARYVPYNNPGAQVVQPEEEKIEVIGSIRKSVWDDQPIIETGDFDPEAERLKKEQSKPYVLEHDAFYENDFNREQYTLTYFEEDDVLVDDKERPIPNKDNVVGAGNLRFGYGTDQKDVVLIHNPLLGVDYEVTRDKGSYAREILNYEPKERRKAVGKFRDSDE